MKRTLIMALSAGILLTGCANAAAAADQITADASSSSAVNTNAAGAEAASAVQISTAADAENGERPPEVKMIYGEISEIIGNAVTVREIETRGPGMGGPGGQPAAPLDENGQPDFSQMEIPEGVTPNGNGRPDFNQGQMPEGFTPGEMPEGFTPGEIPEGVTGGERGERPNRQGGGGPGASREPRYTGEVIDIIIPVGLPVTTVETNTEGAAEETEIQLPDIKIGDMITFIYKEDGVTIDTVSISSGGTSGGGTSGIPGGGDFFFGPGGGMPPGMGG